MTGGIGPDASIDAVGMEAHGAFADNILDQIKVSTFLGTDRGHVIRQVIMATRKGGRVSMPGVYGGFLDKFPIGALMQKGLTLKTGQTHMQRYMKPLYTAIAEGKIDSTFLISHRLGLEERAGSLQEMARRAGHLHQDRPQAGRSKRVGDRSASRPIPALPELQEVLFHAHSGAAKLVAERPFPASTRTTGIMRKVWKKRSSAIAAWEIAQLFPRRTILWVAHDVSLWPARAWDKQTCW